MSKAKTSKGTGAFRLLSFALLTIFFIGIALFDGPEWCKDSPSYESMDFSREPVYPLFLMLLRMACNAMGITATPYDLAPHLTAAVLLQSLLWVGVIWYLGCFVYDISTRYLSEKKSLILSAIAMLSQVGVAVLNRFVANRGSMYSESIMTESLAMPLFVFFTITLVKSLENYNINACIALALQGILISSIRKQMLITLLMWGATSFVLHLFVKKYRSLQKFFMTFIAVIAAFVMIQGLDCVYNQAIRGVFTTHVGNSRGGLDTVLYTAEPEDAELFENADPNEFPELKSLFTRIYDECQARQLTIDYAPGYELGPDSNILNSDWVAMVDHYAQSYDVIGFEIVLPMCDEYVAEHFPELDQVHAQIKENQVEAKLLKVLMFDHIGDIFKGKDKGTWYVLSANVVKAFVMSNANIAPRILITVSAVMYALFVAAMILMGMRRRPTFLLLGLVMILGLAINCVITGSMIFPQPRYMCYSMGLFYLTLCCGILSQ
ncbi:hypothetical protein [Butyrivibrio sp. AE2032]|uniref:hypothetical protein n=1 Tax=Butyrivibrio sp. AE2032 TaxID=1458463 RepID=UPI000556E550|nr:hypothetical protein [Butyrivibrio sp. AE2032]